MEKQSDIMTTRSYIDDMLNMDKDDLEYFETESSEISESYKGLNILVTGGSGFLGKLLIEKLLRSCSNVGKIYMLMREKKGKTPEQRLTEHFDDVVYLRLKRERPNFLQQIVLIKGDTSLNDLGLSTKTQDLLIETTNIVFHGAATVRFDERIQNAVNINVRGTKSVLLLAKKMKNLKGFIHISTAFSNCIHDYIEEKFYTPPMDPNKILSMVDLLDDDELELLSNKIVGKYPNTYVFSKALGEEVVRKYSTGIPTCVVRPSIMTATCTEPVPGWINNYYGVAGIIIGVGLGIMRTLHCDGKNVAEIFPADYVINNIIVAGWDLMEKSRNNWKDQANKPVNPPVFNIVASVQNPLTWNEFMYYCNYYHDEIPNVTKFWHSILFLIKRYWLYNIAVFFLHTIPAVIVDILAALTGRKPMLMKVYEKIDKLSNVIGYFSMNKWQFDNKNVLDLWNRLSPSDKKIFYFNAGKLDWNDYFCYFIRGMRFYILKESWSTLPAGRIRAKWFKYLHFAFCTVLLFLLGWGIFILLRLVP